jgi:hypothetical protein
VGKVVVSEFVTLDGVIEDPGDILVNGTARLVRQTPVGPDGVLVLTYEPARDRT